MDNNEVTTALPDVKWEIMDADRADDNVLLSINLTDLIENIIQTGIVILQETRITL